MGGVLMGAALVLGAAAAHGQAIQVSKDNRTIALTTTDTASSVADMADVSVGYQVYGNDEDSTYAEGSRISNAVMKALSAAGVKPEDIASTGQNLMPINDNDKARYSKGIRFELSQQWTVTTTAKNAASVLHTAVTAGANDSGNVNWKLSDPAHDALEAEASAKALAHAKLIADRMASGLSIHLGPLVYASNQMPERPVTPMYAMAMGGSLRKAPMPAQPLALSPQKVSLSATIYAVFAVE
jgi:uncharacterized protein YggE